MRSGMHGTLSTLLLLIPVISIPALAIFGIPKFVPIPMLSRDGDSDRDGDRRSGKSSRSRSDDFFTDDEELPADDEESDTDTSPGRIGDSVPIAGRGTSRSGTKGTRDADSRLVDSLSKVPRRQRDSMNLSNGSPPPGLLPDESSSPKKQRPSGTGITQVGYEEEANDVDWGAGQSEPDVADAKLTRQPSAYNNDARTRPFDGKSSVGGEAPEREAAPPTKPKTTEFPRNVKPDPNVKVGDDITPTGTLAWTDAERRLNELDIRNFRLAPGRQKNQYVFICSYTPPETPRVSYRFEAEADEPLKAVEKVLLQIEEWRLRER